MIDLKRTREELLRLVKAEQPLGEALSDLTDPRVVAGNARVRLFGHAKKDVFPLLKVVLSEHFARTPRSQLLRDLLVPLRSALGNACKHGNARDPARAVAIEMVLTRQGALIAVTDEGPGFDVALMFRRFEEQNDYREYRGAGFRSLHQAASIVSYENGGRTLLLCFRLERRRGSPLSAHSGRPFSGAAGRESHRLRSALSAQLPDLSQDQARLDSCRLCAPRGPAFDDCGARCVLRVAAHEQEGLGPETRILTARLHPTMAAAAADFEAAKSLHESAIATRLLIPRPVARLSAAPRVVLYDFDPWLNLREYLTHRGSLKSLRHAAERAGQTLAALHRSQLPFRIVETAFGKDRFRAMVARAESNLAALGYGVDLVNCFRHCAERVREWAGGRQPSAMVPIHGALGWDCIQFGVDGRFYLYRFESCRLSDPGLDLGGFAADLVCYARARPDEDDYSISQDAFLKEYNSKAEHPIDADNLHLYAAHALIERFAQTPQVAKANAQSWLGALVTTLREWDRVGTSELLS